MKKTIVCLFLLLLWGCADPVHFADSTVIVDFKGSGTVVRIENYGKIECVYILTCAHVVPQDSPLAIVFSRHDPYFGLRVRAEIGMGFVRHRDGGIDLAIVEVFVPAGTAKAVRIGRLPPRLGEKLWCSSYPLGKYILTTGVAAGQDGNELLSSAAVYGGSSGGGVYNRWGELVGIVRKRTIHNIAGYVPVSKRMVEAMLKKRD